MPSLIVLYAFFHTSSEGHSYILRRVLETAFVSHCQPKPVKYLPALDFPHFLRMWLCDEACIKGCDGCSMPSYRRVRMNRIMWHLEDVPWVSSSEKSLNKLQGSGTIQGNEHSPLSPNPLFQGESITRLGNLMSFEHAIERCIATAALYRKCAGKTLALGKSEEGSCSRGHEACVECTSSWRSILRSRFLRPDSHSSRIGL